MHIWQRLRFDPLKARCCICYVMCESWGFLMVILIMECLMVCCMFKCVRVSFCLFVIICMFFIIFVESDVGLPRRICFVTSFIVTHFVWIPCNVLRKYKRKTK